VPIGLAASIITALIGAVMGIPLVIFLAALVTQAMSKCGVSLSVPVTRASRRGILGPCERAGSASLPIAGS
jgi:ABC-type antimicrobial peptide transport system permease subunit